MIVYRLASRRYPALDGAGASLYGGRWNHRGTPVIYSAATRSLCALEILASAGGLANDYLVTPIEIPDDLATTTLSADSLPAGWNGSEPTRHTRDAGTNWVNSLTSAVLVVPSAVIPQECNYILNPRHRDFTALRFGSPEPFHFDQRLYRR